MEKSYISRLSFYGSKYILGILKTEDYSIFMESTSEILSRLKLLGHIQKGEKLASRTMLLQQDGWSTRLNRSWIAPDNRNNTLKIIREVITRAFEILIHNLSSDKESDSIQCKMIVQDLIKSQVGILNLKFTYGDDTKFGCDLDILIQLVLARLAEIKTKNPSLFEPDVLTQPSAEHKDNTL